MFACIGGRGIDGYGGSPAGDAFTDDGQWLAAHRWEMDRGESAWLTRLAEFDRAQGWAADGQLSCVAWLMWRTQMSRPTAYEKLRVGHELSRRHMVAEAFADGRISYSAVRAITRIDMPDPDVDQAHVELAQRGSIVDVERMVRVWQLHADQHRPPVDPYERRGLRIVRASDGTGRIEITLTTVELEEAAATIQAFLDLHAGAVDESSAGDSRRGASVDESSAGDFHWWGPARRADAFMAMLRTAIAHAGQTNASTADRYLVHLVYRDETTTLSNGNPLDREVAKPIFCDSSTVEHTVGDNGEPLYLGRRSRHWSTAQRRAVLVRDSFRCRFPGCTFSFVDIHHQLAWEAGGATDINNGMAQCSRHHHLLHAGYTSEGDTNGKVTFRRPDGTIIGTTRPAGRSVSQLLPLLSN